MNTSFRPGKKWLDTSGKPIQAHGFSVFYRNGVYYWYGENKEFTKKGGKIWHWGVRCYISKDLYNWEDKGLIIPPQPEDRTSPLHPSYGMDRPHILYCEKTGKYVAWMKIFVGGKGLSSQFMCVMQADNFFGPYEFVHKVYKPLGMDTGDFALFTDDDKRAYFIFERPHFETVCATLTDDYTGVTGEYSSHYTDLKPPYTREAPAIFKKGKKYYLFTSGTSGYYPNASKVAVFSDFHGEWTDMGDPCIGDKTNTTFNSQISSVLKVADRDLYIALADRWLPNPLVPKMSKMIIKGMERAFRDYQPDYGKKEAPVLPVECDNGNQNTYKSRYVWLPVEWEGEKPVLRWHSEWRLETFGKR